MPIANGYVGLGKETTFGAAVSPTVYLPVKSVEVTTDPQVYYPEEIRGSRGKSKGIPMGQKHEGAMEIDAEPSTVGHLLLGALGSVQTTETSPGSVYSHVFTPANTLPSFTLEKYDTVMTQRVSGLKIDTLSLSVEAGGDGALIAEVDFMAQKVADQGAASTANYTDRTPFTFTNVTVEKGGSVNDDVKTFTVEIANALKDDHYTLRKSKDVQNITEGLREVTGSVSMYFKDKADYQAFLNGTKDNLKLKFEGALIAQTYYDTLEIELPNISYDAYGVPMGAADDEIMAELEFTALVDSDLGYEIKATLQNATTSY